MILQVTAGRAFVRERPFITHAVIDIAMSPLDRYSGSFALRRSVCWSAAARAGRLAELYQALRAGLHSESG